MKIYNKPDKTIHKLLGKQKIKNDTFYVWSQFVLNFVCGRKKVNFNTLTRQLLETDTEKKDRFTSEEIENNDTLSVLMQYYFLVPENMDQCEFYKGLSNMMRVFEKKKGIRSFTILPTLGCNARCIYCYEEGFRQVKMNDETIRKTIDLILQKRRNNTIKLNWFGGEPLLCTETIDRISRAMHDSGIDYSSSMISNGSLITPEVVRKMTGLWKLKRIQISMDGNEADYKYRKNYRVYHNEYYKVMNAVSLMSEAGIIVTVRCNVDEENVDSIPRFLDDMNKHIRCKKRWEYTSVLLIMYAAVITILKYGTG